MTNPAILAEDLTYRYGDLLAVDHINFDVAEGEILGFLGPNGAGKTTTIKMLTGQMRPKAGRATLLGMDIVSQTTKIHEQIGVCFEIANLYEAMTGIEVQVPNFVKEGDVIHIDTRNGDYVTRV